MAEVDRLHRRVAELEASLTAHDELQRELERSDVRFRRLFDHSSDAIVVVDPEHAHVVDANPRACALFGYSRQEIRHVPMMDLHPLDDMPKVEEFTRTVIAQGSGYTGGINCRARSGDIIAAEISASMTEHKGRQCAIVFIRDISDRRRLEKENAYLVGEIRSELRFGSIVGRSAPLRQILQWIDMVAPTDASVLITGESGCGKELVASEIHQRSDRRERPLVRVNCASIPKELFESEFFGHVKGAFTGAVQDRTGRFQLAHRGTIFLDEIGEVPLELQSKLLRVLQEQQFERVGDSQTHKVDVRIVAATNRDLRAECDRGRFREDLYFRLNVFPIHVPPLRERKDDIGPLAEHCMAQSSQRMGIAQPQLTPAHIRTLESYDWPGNVRELQNVIDRTLILSRGGELRFDRVLGGQHAAQLSTPQGRAEFLDSADLSLEDLKRLERDIIVRELEAASWKVYGSDGAAERLGLRPTTLASRMKKLGIAKSRGNS